MYRQAGMGNFWDETKPRTAVVSGPFVVPGGGVQSTRKNPVTGLQQIQVLDPDNPNRVIWVDAIWNPARDLMVPVDAKYGATFPPSKYFPAFNQFDGSGNVIDFSSPLNLGLPSTALSATGAFPALTMPAAINSTAQSNGGDGTWLLLVAGGLLIFYLMSR